MAAEPEVVADTVAQAGIGENPAPGPPLALTSARIELNKVSVMSVTMRGAMVCPLRVMPISWPSTVTGAPSSPGCHVGTLAMAMAGFRRTFMEPQP